MGVYDTYGELGAQLKCGDVSMEHYKVGDTVPLEDGVYLTYEGAIVIKDGRFIAESARVFDKYGGEVTYRDILDRRNPVVAALKPLIEEPK